MHSKPNSLNQLHRQNKTKICHYTELESSLCAVRQETQPVQEQELREEMGNDKQAHPLPQQQAVRLVTLKYINAPLGSCCWKLFKTST